jgi:CDP-diglyceride synthetase
MCLVIYIITVIVIVLAMYKLKRTIWASLLWGLIFGMMVLLIIQPPSDIENKYNTTMESSSWLYFLIFFMTPVYVVIYSLTAAYYDFQPDCSKFQPLTNKALFPLV